MSSPKVFLPKGGRIDDDNKIVWGVFAAGEYNVLDPIVVLPDSNPLHKAIPKLERCLPLAFKQLNLVKDMRPGLQLSYRQAIHLGTHAIGVVVLLERVSRVVSDVDFCAYWTLLVERTRSLFVRVLEQRTATPSMEQPLSIDPNPDEAARFVSDFNASFLKSGDVGVLDPQVAGSELPMTTIVASPRAKPPTKSGEIEIWDCVVTRNHNNVAYVTVVNKREQFEVQYNAESHGYHFDLLKWGNSIVRLKVAPSKFGEGPRAKWEYYLIEILGVEKVSWDVYAGGFVAAAKYLTGLPNVSANYAAPGAGEVGNSLFDSHVAGKNNFVGPTGVNSPGRRYRKNRPSL